MSKGLNKVQLIGNLGADPDLRYTQSGSAVLTMRLAVNESWLKDGEKQERTEWCRCVIFGQRADGVAKYLHKGSRLYLEGRMQTREWEDKDGHKRWTTEIVCNELLFLDSKGGECMEPLATKHREEHVQRSAEFPPDDFGSDDLPF